ncbi:interleukin-17 receptor C isoform X2 [Mugil cephalus]|uniref:interleukin-17 receptor C isoform X2 n=1 Tax=Mugil cephalus TaxID=48193 RepID=UPI001FB829E6|nr:interleukin-17 receptor C isoform X2 [Mugil cephalus]
MALSFHLKKRVFSLVISVMHLCVSMSTDQLEIHEDAPELTCSKGLSDCRVSQVSEFSAALREPCGTVDVATVQLKGSLCCSKEHRCNACLQVIISLREKDNANYVSEESGDGGEEEALVKVCFSSPGSRELCKALQFNTSGSSLGQLSEQSTQQMQLVLTERVNFGAPIVVSVHSEETYTTRNITLPSLEEICSKELAGTIRECDVPRFRATIDHERNVVLQLENNEARQDKIVIQLFWDEMPLKVLEWPKGKTQEVISSDFITPCLCFQAWWNGSSHVRGKYCPFKAQQGALERMQHNVAVTLVESQLRDGGVGLSWNVTAPCKAKAEVWLCKKDLAGGQCEEVKASRQHLRADWKPARNTHWQAGEFNVTSHPLLCVQMKVDGMALPFEPHCPFTMSRLRWSLPLLIGLMLIILAMLGAYFIQGILKGYMWRWFKEDDVKGAVGGGHVVLLYPPNDDRDLPGLLCHLGSSLQALGFSVSLDLWSHVELGILGPVPWLHSRLDRVQRQGGKVVLVLTQATWTRAEEWGAQSWQKNRNRDTEEGEAEKNCPPSSPCVDVFSASLSCILADYLQGRAGERFMLVQFESHPPEPPGGFRPLPQLFRGLHVYSLPSQSLGFLTELAGARQTATASARRKRAGGLRMASRALAQRLSGFTTGTNVLRLTGVPQTCVGVGVDDSTETVPLQPCLITPPSSPDTNPKVSEMGWV